jgi:hypothetical protein
MVRFVQVRSVGFTLKEKTSCDGNHMVTTVDREFSRRQLNLRNQSRERAAVKRSPGVRVTGARCSPISSRLGPNRNR